MNIISAIYVISSATHKQCPPPDNPEYAFIGRSNVGKSSLINMITGKQNLAKTSATPGKTKLINHFEVVSSDKRNGSLQIFQVMGMRLQFLKKPGITGEI